ncbi:hypothetical protein AA0535_0630 [Asaia krungthepensis NRIC 0535]|uniref:Uncharacterized protein n=1 Tax=Asaia krungthepensis NRIC 0535 TaxID=1307925 RepID=A0ABQ0PYR0_9PROT|nr:hypothetical protein AA0535_0630 [Asaia krungthepensis NRIC 0535]
METNGAGAPRHPPAMDGDRLGMKRVADHPHHRREEMATGRRRIRLMDAVRLRLRLLRMMTGRGDEFSDAS